MKILGIDLGTNSIGWAIRNTNLADNQIEDYGVITFEKGVASEKGQEFPKVQKRTESRGKRRNYQAEKYRKYFLLDFLIEKNMCPLTREELDQWRKYKKGYQKKYPQSEVFINWLRFDFDGDGKPDFHLLGKGKNESYYVFRAFSVDEKYKNVFENNPHILGRVLYQLVQRRGFKGREEEESKTILNGSEKNGVKGKKEIEDYINIYGTLGAALYYWQKEKGGRIRQRYNLRKDYEAELKKICEIHNISESDSKKLWKAIIWQRPLRTQKGLIGNCIYERHKKRIAVSHPLYEEYRTWIFINNLRIIPPCGIDLPAYLHEKIYPLFYKSDSDFELSRIDKQLIKDGASRLSKHSNKTKVLSVKLLKKFKDIFGEDWKNKLRWDIHGDRSDQPSKKDEEDYTFEDLWHILVTFDGQENLKDFALKKLALDEEKADKFSKIILQKGYATLSLSAIKKILPYLHKGILYSHSVYLANLHKVLGENKVSDTLINRLIEQIDILLKNNESEKENIKTVNNLISEMLNSDTRYSITDGRGLDKSEEKQVYDKIIDTYGQESWNQKNENEQKQIIEIISSHYLEFLKKPIAFKGEFYLKPPRLHDKIFSFLQTEYHVSNDRKKYLWHPSEQENYTEAEEYYEYSINKRKYYVKEAEVSRFIQKNPDAEFEGRQLKLLGNPEPLSKGLKNPMALKSLYKLKNLLNYLIQQGKIDEETKVVVEIARELNDKNMRKAIEKWQKDREKENEKYRKEIREYSEQFPHIALMDEDTLIRKYRLWKEQGEMCIYTGKIIPITKLFSKINNYDIEHTIPVSISFDDELKNLTIADSRYNRIYKGKKFPSQLLNYDSEVVFEGETLKPIIENMESLFGKRIVEKRNIKGKEETIIRWKKITDLEEEYDEWRKKASYASSKDIKDNCIIRYHMIKMKLDYWKAKLATFTISEYKSGWRNSQLQDTQIITKYALPYLKTLFKKVSVEKGTVTSIFKKVYGVQNNEPKNRNFHSHHAEDAAVLTLIPNAFHRERIIKEYGKELDNKTEKTYHEQPLDWEGFSNDYIKEIRNKILINNLVDNRTLTQTYKVARKRGKIDYIKFKDEHGFYNYKLDGNGNKIPKVLKGDTMRGQLHGETFYGAIKQPVRNSENQIIFDNNQKMVLKDDTFIVVRKPLLYKKDPNSPGFKTLEEIEKVIVDKALFAMIKKQVDSLGFKEALTDEGVYMLDAAGNRVGNRIRRIRCFEKQLKYKTAVKIHKHQFESSKEHKKYTLATNGVIPYCLFYKNNDGRAMEVISIMSLSEIQEIKSFDSLLEEFKSDTKDIGRGRNKLSIPFYTILKKGDKVIFYQDSIEELMDLEVEELSRRMFKVYQFEADGKIKFKHHLVAGVDTELKKENKEYSSVNFDEEPIFLRLTQGQWNFAIEHKDFEMRLDGRIIWNL